MPDAWRGRFCALLIVRDAEISSSSACRGTGLRMARWCF